ncbi:MAG TPA: aldo/keto reductase, partial [Myxococcales bacterium]|nr:aldo/keto reductase [Myxococcales bacterium]
GTRLETWKDSWTMTATEQNWRTLDKVLELAARHDASPAAISLAWLLQKPEVSSVIVGARTVQQLHENLRALEVKLPAQEVKELDEVSAPQWGYPYNFIGAREPW